MAGSEFWFEQSRFETGFNHLMGQMPKGIQASKYKLDDPNQMSTCQTKPKRTTQWFINLGSSTSSRNWKKYPNAYKQMNDGIRPPRASLNLSRQLFRECKIIRNTLLGKMSTAIAEKTDETPAPQAIHPSSQSTNPVVTPSAALTVQEDTVIDTEATPFIDDFVDERDKSNKAKLTGVLKETVGILAPNKHDRSLKVISANGKETLLSMVPKSETETGFFQAAHKSNWLADCWW